MWRSRSSSRALPTSGDDVQSEEGDKSEGSSSSTSTSGSTLSSATSRRKLSTKNMTFTPFWLKFLEIQDIITQYEQLLGSQCEAVDRAEEDKVILALKALRTIGHLRRGQAVVEKCYTDATNSMFIRLAAIDTIKQINCGQNEYDFKRQLFATFSDASADSELRIGAYLALMNCPSQSMVNLVKNVLVNEPVNQGTHLTLSSFKSCQKLL